MDLNINLLITFTLLAFCTACSSVSTKPSEPAEAPSTSNTKVIFPTKEKAFVKAIEQHDKRSIIAQLGEPAKAEDVRIKGSNRIVASIWHYHNINTDENGKYYEATELDFLNDKVVQVVFFNNDGSEEITNKGHAYELPK